MTAQDKRAIIGLPIIDVHKGQGLKFNTRRLVQILRRKNKQLHISNTIVLHFSYILTTIKINVWNFRSL